HLRRSGYSDSAGLQLYRVPVAIDDLHRTRTVLHGHLLTAGRFENQLLLTVGVIEGNLDPVPRADDFLEVLTGSIHCLRRRIASVPEATQHERASRITCLERNQNFVADIGNK